MIHGDLRISPIRGPTRAQTDTVGPLEQLHLRDTTSVLNPRGMASIAVRTVGTVGKAWGLSKRRVVAKVEKGSRRTYVRKPEGRRCWLRNGEGKRDVRRFSTYEPDEAAKDFEKKEKEVVSALSDIKENVEEKLTSSETGFVGNVYFAWYGFLFALGAGFLFSPEFIATTTFNVDPTPLNAILIRFCGVLFFQPTIISYCLGEAAVHGRLESETYKRMNVGSAYAIGMILLAKAFYFCYTTTTGQFQGSIILFAALGLFHVKTWLDSETEKPIHKAFSGFAQFFKSVANSLQSGTRMQKIYAALAGAAALNAIAFMFVAVSPLTIPVQDPLPSTTNFYLTSYLWMIASNLTTLLAVNLASLQDAAGRDRLSASTFRTLNAGLFVNGALCLVLYVLNFKKALPVVLQAVLATGLAHVGVGAYAYNTYKKA